MTLENRLQDLFKTLFPEEALNFTDPLDSNTLTSWDSLKFVIIVLTLEEEFNIALSNDEVLSLDSYKSILSMLKEKGFS
jgi:acyl carrier protein